MAQFSCEQVRDPCSPVVILVVEDDDHLRSAIALLLDMEGYHVLTASSQMEALAEARATPEISLVLSDFNLSDGSTGNQVIRVVRAAVGRLIPAALMSGDITGIAYATARAIGVDLLEKPFRVEQMLSLLSGLLNCDTEAGPRPMGDRSLPIHQQY